MKTFTYFICLLMALVASNSIAATKHKNKKKKIKNVAVVSPYVIAIGYLTIDGAFTAVKQSGFTHKANAKPFGW